MNLRNRAKFAVACRAWLAASDADTITVSREALRWLATMAAFIGALLAWCYVVSLIA